VAAERVPLSTGDAERAAVQKNSALSGEGPVSAAPCFNAKEVSKLRPEACTTCAVIALFLRDSDRCSL
jgi:hypothetical protein